MVWFSSRVQKSDIYLPAIFICEFAPQYDNTITVINAAHQLECFNCSSHGRQTLLLHHSEGGNMPVIEKFLDTEFCQCLTEQVWLLQRAAQYNSFLNN